MESAQEISADEIINKNPVTASVEESLSQIKNTMEDEKLRAIPVVNEKNHFQGAIGYRELVRFIQFNPSKTKVERVLHQPPEFEMSDSLVDLAQLRINSGRKMMVAMEGKKLAGIIGDYEFMDAMLDVEEFSDVNTRDISVYDILMVKENDSVEKARHMMLDNNVSRLPVIDSDGNLTGKIDSIDILKTMVPIESQDSGGTAGNRDGSEVNISGGGEKEGMSGVTVDQLMETNPCSSENHMRGDKALKKMGDEEAHYIFFTEAKYPEFVVTLKDFIDYVADLEERNTVLVQLTGVDVPEEKAALHEKIRKQLQGSIGRKVNRPEEVKLHIKKAEKDGKKHRYEINLGFQCEYGYLKVEEEGWELLDVLDTALGDLDRILRDKHDQRTDYRK